jgi:hypothetical protein
MYATAAIAVQPLEYAGPNLQIPAEVFVAAQTTANDPNPTPWAYIFRLTPPDRVTATNIDVIKDAVVTSLWSEDSDLYFAGSTTRTFSPGDPVGVPKPGASPDFDAFLGKSEGVASSRRWMVGFDTMGANNSGYGTYGNTKGYILGSDPTNFYIVQYPVY